MKTPSVIIFLLSAALQAAEPLRVGMELSYPPFECIGPDGQPQGVSVEMARALADDLGRPLKIENIPFTGLIPALKSGKIDLIISSMTATPERAKAVAFSDPYLKTGLGALVPVTSKAGGLADIDHPRNTVVVRQGTTGEVFARQNLKSARLLTLDKESACVVEVVQGKAAAFIYDQMSVFQNNKRNQETTRALLAPLQTESWAIALRPGNDAFLAQVNAFLSKYRASGGFDKLSERFLSAQGIPFFF